MKIDVTRVVQLRTAFAGLSQSYVRLHNGFIDASKSDKSRLHRRQAVLVRNLANQHSILRYVLGDPSGRMKPNEAALDYDAVDMLQYSVGDRLFIRPARWFEVYKWYWGHPDLNVRISMRASLIGLVLGIVGLVISLLPMI